MGVLRQLFDFYLNSSIHVALSVCALTWVTWVEFDLDCDLNLLLFVFFASITGYNFVKYFGLAKFHHRSLAKWLRVIQVFSFFCFLALGYFTTKLQVGTIVYIGIFAIVTFLYAIPMLPKRMLLDKQQNLRSISGVKVYVIGLVWSGVTVFMPIINSKYSITIDVVITGVQRFVYVLILMIPFEIRDLQYDSVKLATIPQQIGVKRTKMLGIILLVVFFLMEFLKTTVDAYQVVVLFAVSLITGGVVLGSKIDQREYYSSFWAEGLPLLWLILAYYML
ncbi:UbiA prenyltransferase family protein [Mangrovimonas aestuarii]|uniref:hypothetical protein n=1 Tax=Mangrovimonas aestuarii TaxID=3018443 RepID=UPI00237885C9|nr:hypothetical protein [Mangrovimonas aestuarii]